eukprot:SAG11_NODE_1212_length_5506_cov_3.818384_2_plen_173_part_00
MRFAGVRALRRGWSVRISPVSSAMVAPYQSLRGVLGSHMLGYVISQCFSVCTARDSTARRSATAPRPRPRTAAAAAAAATWRRWARSLSRRVSHTLSLSHTHALSLCLSSLRVSHALVPTLSLSPCVSLRVSHTLSLSVFLTLSQSFTHTHTWMGTPGAAREALGLLQSQRF